MAATQDKVTRPIQFIWALDSSSPYMAQIDKVIKRSGWVPLNDHVAKILVALDGDAVIGFHVLQMFPHAEPLWVDPEYRASGVAEALSDRMLEFLTSIGARGFMVIADSPHAQRLCEERGMKRVSSPVYIG